MWGEGEQKQHNSALRKQPTERLMDDLLSQCFENNIINIPKNLIILRDNDTDSNLVPISQLGLKSLL